MIWCRAFRGFIGVIQGLYRRLYRGLYKVAGTTIWWSRSKQLKQCFGGLPLNS